MDQIIYFVDNISSIRKIDFLGIDHCLQISVRKFSNNLLLNLKIIGNFGDFLQIRQEKVRNLPSNGYIRKQHIQVVSFFYTHKNLLVKVIPD